MELKMEKKEEYLIDLTDILVRIEGTINVLHKPDVIVAHRKLQGLRDKVRHAMQRVSNDKSSEVLLKDRIQEVTSNNDTNRN